MLVAEAATTDWNTLGTTLVTAVLSIVGGIGTAFKLFLSHMEKRRQIDMDRDEKRDARVENMVHAFLQDLQDNRADVVTALNQHSQAIREVVSMQRETNEVLGKIATRMDRSDGAVLELSHKVDGAEKAVLELHRKLDTITGAL